MYQDSEFYVLGLRVLCTRTLSFVYQGSFYNVSRLPSLMVALKGYHL